MDKKDVIYIYIHIHIYVAHTHIYTHTHTMEYYSAIIKKDETWMNLEGTMLSEISQMKKEKYHMISLICGI